MDEYRYDFLVRLWPVALVRWTYW